MGSKCLPWSAFLLFCALVVAPALDAQAGFGGRWGSQPLRGVVQRYDADGDGRLNDRERAAARRYVLEMRAGRAAPGSSSPRLPIRSSLAEDLRRSRTAAPTAAGESAGMYDEATLRTLYLRFPTTDWFGELTDFYDTDVEVPADLIVDGRLYPRVGARFRGNSSYWAIGASLKKSFNLSLDYGDRKQRLGGYRTLNLLNAHADPSFLREVLFSRISRNYIPAPKANFVRLVINGENWGIYLNVQQVNRDFLQEWFGGAEGVLWKVPPNRGGSGGLAHKGGDPLAYRGSFELGGKENPQAWIHLIRLSEVLTLTPDTELEQALSSILNIDETLWFLALENVFIDNDGYFSRGADYLLYEDSAGRFHPVTHDNNETFRYAGGGGPNHWPDSEPMLSPLGHADNPGLPLISRLLGLPHLRARYLAHIRTIVAQWLDWRVLRPLIDSHRLLIADQVAADDKKLYSLEAFTLATAEDDAGRVASGGFGVGGAPSFKQFVTQRRDFLLSHPQIDRPVPEIRWIEHPPVALPGEPIRIQASVSPADRLDGVLLYYAAGARSPFREVPMFDDGGHGDARAGDGVYSCQLPPFAAGAQVRYYVEARAIGSLGTTAFRPANTEWGAIELRVGGAEVAGSSVVINELMARNRRSAPDPQGEYDDWVELYNRGTTAVQLSGMYLSDDPRRPRKWAFPEGVSLSPGGYLLVWADEDPGRSTGLHAAFKLSGQGETLLLVDRDETGNRVLDRVDFGEQPAEVSLGRVPDGSGEFQSLYPSPGTANHR